jgi:hypothetical protein
MQTKQVFNREHGDARQYVFAAESLEDMVGVFPSLSSQNWF